MTPHCFTETGKVSVWATTQPIEGVHRDFLEGCDQLFMWLLVDFEVAIDGAFATNFTDNGSVGPLAALLEDLHASESFAASAVRRGDSLGITGASFVVALYDYAYDPERVGLSADERGSELLTFVGAFSYDP